MASRPVVNKELGNRVRIARNAIGLTQPQLAERIGLSQAAVSEVEQGRIARPDALADYAFHLKTTEDWLMGDGSPDKPAPRVQAATPNASAPEYDQVVTGGKVPVLGHSAGGDDGRFIMNGQRITDVFCPPILSGISGAYAVYIYGDSMEPRYFAGETAWLHPYLPVRRDDFVVAQIRGAGSAEGDPPDAYVKQFVSRSKQKGLVLRQLNPPDGHTELMTFDDDDVFSVHKVVFSGMS